MTPRMVRTPRTVDHRIDLLRDLRGEEGEEVGPEVVHVIRAVDGGLPSDWKDTTTMCGVTFHAVKGEHEYMGFRPLSEVTCEDCRTEALRIPFTHMINTGRTQLGRGALRGSGMSYGTTWRCPCGAKGQVNVSPSAGGTQAAQGQGERHLDAVEAEVKAEAAKLLTAYDVAVSEYHGAVAEAEAEGEPVDLQDVNRWSEACEEVVEQAMPLLRALVTS